MESEMTTVKKILNN